MTYQKPPIVEDEVGSLDVRLVNKKSSQYKHEAKLADKVYKSFVTDGISRLEKVNGRFLASQTIKLDILERRDNPSFKRHFRKEKSVKYIASSSLIFVIIFPELCGYDTM